jgi:hypothetical protein
VTTLVRIAAFAATAILAALSLVYVIRVDPADLTWLLFTLTAGAWASVIVLGHAAASGPGIGALTERTFVGLVIALLGTVACLIVTNTDAGRPWFNVEISSLLFRLSILAVLAIPCVWLVLWLSGKLGEAE